ncbi:hypothetical protein CB0940_04364 [Cercospora beticola]|uniref:AB hydrolase-1 domain-containing protein n=1 Tax=Cercospora beticola TaxID=122368 RepID=A0A2G5HK50_CERBT|nr:hypothetical protein CB0940_04364 [Cercospora beticola]PIA92936.1 hypothetical protein CB0940_04364 [Cercospora beticola]WPB01600.1 hypothetical protein RHO25_006229 [Cercospora beticola]CAK1363604.1 unnamed protein product [Cercospora beticola]
MRVSSLLPFASTALCAAVWETLPPTPALPAPISEARTAINGVQLWSQKYNEAAGGIPIVFIAGGLGYSAYFGDVISRVSKKHYVIAVDRRGHGRSTYLPTDFTGFEQFAKDTVDLLRTQGVEKAYWLGWSDGAITTFAGLLDPAINPTIEKAFAFAGSQKPSDTNATFGDTQIFSEFVARCGTEYAQLQPTANFTDFALKVQTLEGTQPNWSDAKLATIDGKKVTIAEAQYDEAVNSGVPFHQHQVIKGSGYVKFTDVSHFAPLQDPDQFAKAVFDWVG